MSTRTARSRGARGLAVLLALVTVGLLIVAGTYGKQWWDQRDAPRDMDGNVVQLDEGDLPPQDVIDAMDVEEEVPDPTVGQQGSRGGQADGSVDAQDGGHDGSADGSASGPGSGSGSSAGPLRLSVPSVDLDVRVGRLSAVGGVVTPPGFTRAYLIRNIGEPLEHNDWGTTYVAMHSVRAGTAPGNRLINVSAGTSRVAVGSKVTLGSNTYRVTGSEQISKGELPTHEKVWRNEPDRLVMITCLQRTSGRSLQNVVIYAERV